MWCWIWGFVCVVFVSAVPVKQPFHDVQQRVDNSCAQINFVCRGKPYVVRTGDTVESISKRLGCPPESIWENNPHLSSQSVSACDEICGPIDGEVCEDLVHIPRADRYELLSGTEFAHARSSTNFAEDPCTVIPKPQSVHKKSDNVFNLTESTKIFVTPEIATLGPMFADIVKPATGFELQVVEIEDAQSLFSLRESSALLPNCNCILMLLDPEIDEDDEYILNVTTSGVVLKSRSDKGVFYALQTLRQLLPAEIESSNVVVRSWEIKEMDIHDKPTYQWRGIMLDVSRHFFTVAEVKHLIDLMALHKLNIFHWHLTDDHGWRVPVDEMPEIVNKGAWRDAGRGKLYGGSYSKLDIMSVLLYAQQRFIEVIPEIDMPGHSQVLLISHPEVGNNITYKVAAMNEWGVSEYTLDPTKNVTYKLVDQVLASISDMFPSDYIHVGGDEANHIQWRSNPDVDNLMNTHVMSSYSEVQAYFEKAVSSMLSQKGKKLVGWDEILDGGAPEGATVMSWRGTNPGVQAARMGHDVVMCPMEHMYFDRKYDHREERGRLGVMGLRDSYNWEPRQVLGLGQEYASKVLGAQGNIWTEGMITIEDVEYLSIPRMSALAEVTWTPVAQRSFDNFQHRLVNMAVRMELMDVQYPILQSTH